MSEPMLHPTLIVYYRPGCHLCDDAEILLRDELAQRAREGLVTASVARVDITIDPDLETRYGTRVPVFAVGADETDLVTTGRQIRDFLERTLPTLA
ncbi:MAG: glutaredoxin family protein [Chloroflexota bacterium]